MGAKIGLGTTVAYETTPGSGTYTPIGEVFEFSPPSSSMDTVDSTDFSHSDGHRRFIAGLIDAGEVAFTLNYDPALTVYGALDTIYKARVSRKWRFTYAGSTVNTVIEGFITGLARAVPVDDRMSLEVTLKVSGLLAEAAS
jgi:hypothetical protein